jgi:hypothetical protein
MGHRQADRNIYTIKVCAGAGRASGLYEWSIFRDILSQALPKSPLSVLVEPCKGDTPCPASLPLGTLPGLSLS